MQSLFRAAAIAAIALPLAFAPLTAQNYRGAWTLYGGGIWFSDFNDNGDFDDFDDFDDDFDAFADLTLEPGWIAGTQLEWWFGNGRFGIRGNAGYTERSFDLEFNDGFDGITDTDFVFGDVNTWLFNGDVMLRILRPERDRAFAPFLAVGAGVAHYNPAGSATIVIPEGNAVFGDFSFDPDGDLLVANDGNAETEFAIDFGLGADIVPPALDFGPFGLGFRVEVMDHYTLDSPAEPLFTLPDDDDFNGVHNLRFTANALMTFGQLFPEEEVAVAPAPPPPAPEPEPEPEPEEEAITVCVVDPSIEGMVGYVDAVYRPATRDTLVMDDMGREAAFETVYGPRAPIYASQTSWYRAGEPMTLTVGDRTLEFVTFGGERVIEPEDLAFLGTYRGTPVFADEDDVEEIEDELEDVREARMDDDLEDLLEERAELAEAVSELDVVYVPTDVGCVFQPYQMTEEVRKVRG